MLTVTHKNSTEPLNHISGFEMQEEVNGALTVSFTSFSVENNPGHALLEEESVVNIDGYEFRVKQLKGSSHSKSVVALSTYFDLTGFPQELIYGGTRTLDEFVAFTLNGTGWAFVNQDVTISAFIPNFGEDNVVKLIQQICSAFECEFQISADKQLIFAKQVGPDNDAQYRYRHNVKTISKTVDTTNMRMKITGKGANGLSVTYTSPYASEFPHMGAAENVVDDRITNASDMLEIIKPHLIDYPETSIELETVEIGDKALGERVWLIYEPLGMEYQTRVMSKRSILRYGKLVTASVTIGNTVPRDLSDILTQQKVEIDEQKKKTRSRFEQTNEKIELAVERFDGEILEAYAKIELTADQIRSEVAENNILIDGAIAKNTTLITQTAGQIRNEVKAEVLRVDGRIDTANSSILQTASSIRSEVAIQVSTLDGKITSTNSSITQLAGQISAKADSSTVTSLGNRISSVEWDMSAVDGKISQKVSQTDYNGVTIASKINQSAANVSISAQSIDLLGITNVANYLTLGTGYGSETGVYFKGAAVSIDTYGDTLRLNAPDTIFTGRVSFNSTVTGLYARFG